MKIWSVSSLLSLRSLHGLITQHRPSLQSVFFSSLSIWTLLSRIFFSRCRVPRLRHSVSFSPFLISLSTNSLPAPFASLLPAHKWLESSLADLYFYKRRALALKLEHVESRRDVSGLCHRGRIVLCVFFLCDTALERRVKRVKCESFSRRRMFVVFFLLGFLRICLVVLL